MSDMNDLIIEMVKKENAEINKHIEKAFEKHFGISIHVVDFKEIKHIMTDFDPVESFMFRGETFLYIERHDGDFDINRDVESEKINVSFNISFNYV